ncbi:MAG TPA: VTT domain-containing protein [Terriglobales bacterium]|nr:VTT domain-containing protein [Terriglobales bacterium]
MNKIKHFIQKYAAWIQHVLAPLGPWGMLAFAAVDGSFLGMPLDAIFVSYVYNDRSRFLLYVVLAAVGSALGSILIYVIGYTGGEVLLRKRLPAERFAKIHASFEKHEFWALMFPAMLPPPTPFKAVVLAAAAFEMNFWHFLLAIFTGRFVRFLLEALLTLWFGPRIVAMTGTFFTHHLLFIASIAAEILAAWIIWTMVKRRSRQKKNAAGKSNSALRGKEQESAG